VKDIKAHFALLFVNVLYGASHVLAKGVMPEFVTPNVFILFRVLGSVLLFWLLISFRKIEKINPKDFPLFIACGLFGVAINQLFFFHGLNLSSAINSGIIMALNPMMVVVLSLFVLKERITMTRMCGILLGALGAILLTFKSASLKSDSSLGDFFLIINCLSYAIYLVLAKPFDVKIQAFNCYYLGFYLRFGFCLTFPPNYSRISNNKFLSFFPKCDFKNSVCYRWCYFSYLFADDVWLKIPKSICF
jgi:Permeases of the drug/metabolite transporter (DMT) superfamily